MAQVYTESKNIDHGVGYKTKEEGSVSYEWNAIPSEVNSGTIVKISGLVGTDQQTVTCITDSPITFNASNNMQEPLKEISNLLGKFSGEFEKMLGAGMNITNILASNKTGNNARYMTKYSNAKVWKSTSALKLGLSFKFFIGMDGDWNAKTEVYDKIVSLTKMCLPRQSSESKNLFIGPGPSLPEIVEEIFKGVNTKSTSSAIKNLNKENKNAIKNANTSSNSSKTIQEKMDTFFVNLEKSNQIMKIVFFPRNMNGTKSKEFNVYPTNIDFDFGTTFSTDGYPTSGSVRLSLETYGMITQEDFKF